MKHEKFNDLLILVQANIPILLHGERGSGKTTLIKQVAEQLSLPFYALPLTRQTTLSYLLGFMNVKGIYVPSLLRKAVEEGGLFLLDELDAADPNVILSLNTLENGFISFPDKLVEIHENFRLCATTNPFNSHDQYTGRSVLDAATLDRFDKISLEVDPKLESSLVSENTYKEIMTMRLVIEQQNSNLHISMRDTLRWEKRKKLKLTKNYVASTLLKGIEELYKDYLKSIPRPKTPQEEEKSVQALWDSVYVKIIQTSKQKNKNRYKYE